MTYEIKTRLSVEEQVSARLQEISISGETPARIFFSPETYALAREEVDPHFNSMQYVIGTDAPPSYMGLPYAIAPLRNSDNGIEILSAEEIQRLKPRPPTEKEVACRLLETIISATEEYHMTATFDDERIVEEYMRRTSCRVTVGEHRFNVIVEALS